MGKYLTKYFLLVHIDFVPYYCCVPNIWNLL